MNPILRYFDSGHLPAHLASISSQVLGVAKYMDQNLPACPETSAGLRKLLEAKDCFVRAALDNPQD